MNPPVCVGNDVIEKLGMHLAGAVGLPIPFFVASLYGNAVTLSPANTGGSFTIVAGMPTLPLGPGAAVIVSPGKAQVTWGTLHFVAGPLALGKVVKGWWASSPSWGTSAILSGRFDSDIPITVLGQVVPLSLEIDVSSLFIGP